MLLRAVGRQMTAAIRQKTAVRSIAISRMALGGGGHGHHHEPTPVYIPKPGSLDWFFCGSGAKPKYEFEPYQPDVGSYIGALVFIGLTVAAVVWKTDAFKKDEHHHGHSAKKEHKKEEKHHHEEKKEAEPVVQQKQEKEEEEPTPAASETPEAAESAEKPAVEAEKEKPKEAVEAEAKTEKTESEEPKPSKSSEETPADAPTTSESNKSDEIHCEYVIIGSGTAAYYASLAIRAKHAEAKVLMIGEEPDLPYNRPPLSKELWWYGDESAGKRLDYTSLSGKKRDIFYEVDGFYVSPEDLPRATHGGVSLMRNTKAVKICASDKKIILEDGTVVGYDKVLIATGARPKREQVFEEASEEAKAKIVYYHLPSDFKRLENGLTDDSIKKVTIVGNGLLAAELGYSIKRKYGDVEVHQVFEQKHVCQDILPEHLAQKSTEAVKKNGVDLRPEQKITGVRQCCKNVVLKLENGTELRTDIIVVATGEQPNTEIVEASGLKIDESLGGVHADKALKVTDNVWAAGAIVSFEDGVLGRRRLNSWEHAQVSGRLAGENMATDGKTEKSFWYQPSFFSKFAPNLHINAIGNCDSGLNTVTVYAQPNGEDPMEKAVTFYTSEKDGTIVGVLLLNVFGISLDVARRIIDDKKKVEDYKEIAKLFPLYEMPKDEAEADPKLESEKSQ